MENNWHLKSAAEIFKQFESGSSGLSQAEAVGRLKKYGENRLPEAKADSLAAIFFSQFQSPLIYILLAAALIVFFTGQAVDSVIILTVLLFNAAVGTIQEGRAQNTLSALKKFAQTKATVLRSGKEMIIDDAEVAPGDILILQEGEKVPADARVILSRNLKIDESMLTGESEPVHKIEAAIKKSELLVPDQKNMAFKGSYVIAGHGQAVAVATGVKTVIGKIAKQIEAIDTESPFKANVRLLARLIIAAVAGISIFLFFFGIITGQAAAVMFATVVSLAVSVIPEGLPIVMTLVLAAGVWRMGKQNVLVKKLQAVEALGQARVIAVDKTGTITKNEMVVQKIYAGDKLFTVAGSGYEPAGEIKLDEKMVCLPNHPELLTVGKIASFCAGARLMYDEAANKWAVAGDPTEAALGVLAGKLGYIKSELEAEAPLVVDFPFDYKLKYHAAIYASAGKKFLAVAGAPEEILKHSRKILRQEKSQLLTEAEKKKLESVFLAMSLDGMRVVALAENREITAEVTAEAPGGLTFVGFLGIKDALRPEAVIAITKITQAHIRTVMITGDHANTAKAIAGEAGIYHPGDLVLSGREIDALTDRALEEKITQAAVFARVTPEHKLRIIRAFKARGEIVAMTGDGVNDAPSLSAADLGIAMGRIGTEVAKEASDIVLLDDNLNSIIPAIEEGRNIYKTIKKVILYLFSTSAGEVLVIAASLFIGLPLPILPAQIIWLNFVTDGFLDVALAMEPKEKRLLDGNFKKLNKFMVDKLMGQRILIMSVTMAAGTIWLFMGNYQYDYAKALTLSLTLLAVYQWFNAWNCRFEEKSIFSVNPLANMYLVGATAIVIALQLLAVYNPFLQKILHTVPLSLSDWLVIVPLAFAIVLVEEIRKFFYRRRVMVYN